MKKDFYLTASHSKGQASITVDTFFINDVPVCMSWYGCDKHPREACMFLQTRKFGTVMVCGVTGQDIPDEANQISRVPEDCPLHRGEG